MKDSIIILILLILLLASQVSALDVPALKGRVNDYADMLSPGETADLQEKMELHEKETSKRAKREFFELGLQHAEEGTGILIMISCWRGSWSWRAARHSKISCPRTFGRV